MRPTRFGTRRRHVAAIAAATLNAAACGGDSDPQPAAPTTTAPEATTTTAAPTPETAAAVEHPCDTAAAEITDEFCFVDGEWWRQAGATWIQSDGPPPATTVATAVPESGHPAVTTAETAETAPAVEEPDQALPERPEQVCVGDTCVDMPEDGWPVIPDDVFEQPEATQTDHGHTHDEPEPTTSTVAPEPEPTTSTVAPEPEPTTSTVAPEPEPEPELKPLPPRPDESLCPEGSTLTPYQREDYSTWYCQRPIPAQVGETIRWPLPPDTAHPSYQQARTRWLSHPMAIWVGMVFHNPDFEHAGYSGISGIVVDIVLREEFSTPLYYVHICVGEPTNREYFIETFPDGFTDWDIVDGFLPPYQEAENQLFRMEVDNLIPLWPCIAEGL